MKYFAILKDSLREALDSKIIYVMFGLSALVVLVVLTLTFEPGSPRDLLRDLGQGRIGDLPGHHSFSSDGSVNIQYQSHRTASGERESPDADLIATYAVQVSYPEKAKEFRAKPERLNDFIKKRFALSEELEIFTIGDVRLLDENAAEESFLKRTFEVDLRAGPVARRLWPHKISLFFGAVPLGGSDAAAPLGIVLFFISVMVIKIGGWVAILISIIITAFFIPNMLRKGTIDLLLVKPIHRPALLVYKYFGGLTFIFINTALVMLGIWLAVGLRSGIWANSFLLLIFSLTFYFAILYAVSALFGVMTQSAVVSILMACGAWLVFFVVGILHHVFEQERIHHDKRGPQPVMVEGPDKKLVPDPNAKPPEYEEGTFAKIIHGLYKVTPRTADLSVMTEQVLMRDFFSSKVANHAMPSSINWTESLIVSFGFIAIVLGLSCWWFATRDY